MTDASFRLSIFFTILLVMLVLESCFPARKSKLTKPVRWLGNFSLLILSSIVARLLIPIGVAGIALYASTEGIGLFNIINLPTWLSITFSVLLLDLMIYWQHRIFHLVPMLWRFHKVHHADSHIDASTGLRFHPVEIALSIILKALAVLILGVPATAVIIFEVALNGFALFNHANIRLPRWLELPLRTILITQVLHRIHHSQVVNETNSNYGFSVSWWDRMFGSYKSQAQKSDEDLDIGLKEWPAKNSNASLLMLLIMPFKK
ncbi:sterol desaturase family protein [Colwellia sp. M166]|uniref:sterol desaturase family protein n=1 Tax=Colwellia sp. M166 TaxID=2583805 RepID=UPI00211DC23B|nr:sterol desaturase family protein [Colwellia sp. M166]UUO24592.1 sterol desaturase family protein [Colwellia sp. M166]|tara:strand:- start:69481 stop:70266 length:786 start_codon:yes stop_codon:yes gene_type:complete